MRSDELWDAIGEIDESYLKEAKEKPNRRKITWVGIGSLAACFLFLLFLPNGFLHRNFLNDLEADYVSKDYTKFSVYYVDGDTLACFTYEIHGGYEEMFFAWKNQNGIEENVVLKDITLQPKIGGDDIVIEDSSGRDCILRIEISSAFADYMEKDNAELLVESLKKTVVSYIGVKISDIEVILVE